MSTTITHNSESPWPHRLAVLLVCATFPLIWVGGLVTTYDAGMAVPDWPTTYGYNLFLYPWQTWLTGPWDLFIEHGHRLLGALVGMLTMALLVAVVWKDSRRWMRWLVAGALVAVIIQGSLGGARVLLDDRQLAMLHGCAGPSFFALCTVIAVLTSRLWRSEQPARPDRHGGALYRWTLLTALLVWAQLLIGANMRHLPVWTSHGTFRVLVMFHLATAGVILLHVALSVLTVLRHFRRQGVLVRPAIALAALTLAQLALGASTWIVKYSWPAWLPGSSLAAGYTLEAEGFWPAMIVTAHVAIGSLILAVSVLLFTRSVRLVRPASEAAAAAVESKQFAREGLAV